MARQAVNTRKMRNHLLNQPPPGEHSIGRERTGRMTSHPDTSRSVYQLYIVLSFIDRLSARPATCQDIEYRTYNK
jgi:hypothetical protein